MSRFKAVLFDYDDTLVNSYPARVKAAELAAEGVLDPGTDIVRIMKEWSGRPQLEIWEDLAGSRQLAEELQRRYQRFYWGGTTREVRPFPGICKVLDELSAGGLAIAVVTSKSRLRQEADGPIGAVVEMRGTCLDGKFDVIVGWGDVKESKPAPAPILYALEKLALEPQEAIMVGDSHIDITTAKRAGTASAGALWGTVAKDLLVQARPDYLLESPDELRSVVLDGVRP